MLSKTCRPVMKTSPTVTKISPPLIEYVPSGTSAEQQTLATIREAPEEATIREAPEEATIAEAFEPNRDRAEATLERVEDIVRVEERIQEEEEGELEEVEEVEEAGVVVEVKKSMRKAL